MCPVGDVAKWPKAAVCKTAITGSNPVVASNTMQTAVALSHSRLLYFLDADPQKIGMRSITWPRSGPTETITIFAPTNSSIHSR